jgi:type VI secretion system secreted protein VgrG
MTSPAGPALRFAAMSGYEEVSRLFEYQISAVSEDGTIKADDLLGKPVAISLDLGGGKTRWFHGIVASFGIDGGEGRNFSYRITARPWMWLLTRSADVRIFQDKSVPDIIREVFAEYQGSVVLKLKGSQKPRSYCVQYRETDFNFVCRLMEEEGIFFWFQHSESKHDLVLANDPGVLLPTPGFDEVPFKVNQQAQAVLPAIHQWQVRQEIQTGKVVLRDYNFEKPATDLKTDPASQKRQHDASELEVYDYPGLYQDKAAGTDIAKLRIEEAASQFGRYTGHGSTPGLTAGAKVSLVEHPRSDQNAAYMVLATQIDMRQADYSSGGGGGSFQCRFTMQRFDEPFRPARVTPKPLVAGPQTAVVVGKGDPGDIVPDKYGRVKLQFHWDRLGKKDANSSCWVRVASPFAGNGFGMIALPRLGQEVVVDFLEGDPDQPLITGRVHNAEQLPPYELPANATVSTLKSRSKFGPADAFNELRFEDKKGSEYVWIQAQKDRFELVEDTLKSEIRKDEHRTVKQNRKELVEGEFHLTVTKGVKHKFEAKYSVDTKEDILLKAGSGYSLQTGKDIAGESGTTISLKAGTDMQLKVSQNLGADAGMNVHIKGGMNVVIEAGMQVTIKAGPSSVVLGPDGVSITGPMVKINSGGGPGAGAGANPVAPTAPEAAEKPELPQDPLTHR